MRSGSVGGPALIVDARRGIPGRSRPSRTPRRALQGGFSLVEILVVIGIMGLLLGIGGLYLGRSGGAMGMEAVTNELRGALRYTRVRALADRSPATAIIDTEAHRVFLVAERTMALWHFEGDGTDGAFGKKLAMTKPSFGPGWVGQAVRFDKGSGAVCKELNFFTPDQGLVVEAAVCPDESGGGTIVEWTGQFSLGLTAGRAPKGSVGKLDIAAETRPLPAFHWTVLTLVYDGAWLTLMANGVVVAERSLTKDEIRRMKFETKGDGCAVGGGLSAFRGLIDEVHLSALLSEDQFKIPDRYTIDGKALAVHFDPRGRLDARYHKTPVTIQLKNGTDKATLEVAVNGTVDFGKLDFASAGDLEKAKKERDKRLGKDKGKAGTGSDKKSESGEK